MTNPKIIVMMLIVGAAASALISLQNPVEAGAGAHGEAIGDVDVEEVVSENATIMTNHTADGATTSGTNSTS